MARKLTERQAAFCRHLITGMSATQAARKAGYSPHYADREAAKLVEKPQVAAELERLRAKVEKSSIMTAQEVLERLAEIARGEVRTEVATKVGIVDLPPSFSDRNRALELLGKHLGMFTDKLETNGSQRIEVVYVDS